MYKNRFKTLFLILSFFAIIFSYGAKINAASNSVNVTLQVIGAPEKKTQQVEDKVVNFNKNNKLFLAII